MAAGDAARGDVADVAELGLRLLPVDQGVLGAGVHDQQRQAMGGQVEGSWAIDPSRQSSNTDPAARGRSLVHPAGRGLGDGVLGIDSE